MKSIPSNSILYKHNPYVLILGMLLCLLLGLVSVSLSFPFSLQTDKLVMVVVGGFFICFSIFVLLLIPKQIILINGENKILSLSQKTKLSNVVVNIPFNEIKSMEVCSIEKELNIYDIEVTLNSGKQFYLFFSGHYGSTKKITMEQRLFQLKKIIFPKSQAFIENF